MKKAYLFLFLFFVLSTFKAKSQVLLGADNNQIKTYVVVKGGIVRLDRTAQDGINAGPYHLLISMFPKSQKDGSDIYMMTFFSKPSNRCYKYLTYYQSDKFLKELVTNFDNPNSGYKRLGKDLKWIDPIKKYEIEILMIKRTNGEGNPVKTTAFILDTHIKQ